jgi:hypothetical protein
MAGFRPKPAIELELVRTTATDPERTVTSMARLGRGMLPADPYRMVLARTISSVFVIGRNLGKCEVICSEDFHHLRCFFKQAKL